MSCRLSSVLASHGQGHLVGFWQELGEEQRRGLEAQIEAIDPEEAVRWFDAAQRASASRGLLDSRIRPLPDELVESAEGPRLAEYERLGLEEVAAGRLAVISLAGGQGTRLGLDAPKGTFDCRLPSGRSLFELQALRLRRLEKLAGAERPVPWYIMTSDATHHKTIDYLERHSYFGLRPEQVVAFRQASLPCFGLDGRILLEERDRVAMAPDGNGGLFAALAREHVLEHMRARGVRSVHVFSVDNVLVRVADPRFVGFCLARRADCAFKVVTKRSAEEPVGVVARLDDAYAVVEYSEISEETSRRTDPHGRLVFDHGNICNHYFSREFLERVAGKSGPELGLHAALKKIPHVDEAGKRLKPDKPNGIKIEKFIFDVLKFAERFAVWRVPRDEEFSALKNADAPGALDCPATARSDLLNLHAKWIRATGFEQIHGDVEICPLLSYAGENLEQALRKRQVLQGPMLLSE